MYNMGLVNDKKGARGMFHLGVVLGFLLSALILGMAALKIDPPYLGKYHHQIFAVITGYVAVSGYITGGVFILLIGVPYSPIFLIFADNVIRGTNSFASRVSTKQLMIGISEGVMPSFVKTALSDMKVSKGTYKALMITGCIVCGLVVSVYFLVLNVSVIILFNLKMDGISVTIIWFMSAVFASGAFIRTFLGEE